MALSTNTLAHTLRFIDIDGADDLQWLASSPGVVSKSFLSLTKERIADLTVEAVKDLTESPKANVTEQAMWVDDLQSKLYRMSVTAKAVKAR